MTWISDIYWRDVVLDCLCQHPVHYVPLFGFDALHCFHNISCWILLKLISFGHHFHTCIISLFCCDEVWRMAALAPYCCPIWPRSVTLRHVRYRYCDPITSAQGSHNSHGNQFVSWPTSLAVWSGEYFCICWLHCSWSPTLFKPSSKVTIVSLSENDSLFYI